MAAEVPDYYEPQNQTPAIADNLSGLDKLLEESRISKKRRNQIYKTLESLQHHQEVRERQIYHNVRDFSDKKLPDWVIKFSTHLLERVGAVTGQEISLADKLLLEYEIKRIISNDDVLPSDLGLPYLPPLEELADTRLKLIGED